MTVDHTTHNTVALKAAAILLETGAVMLQPNDPFTLTSGRKSPVYVDCRRLIAFPRARTILIRDLIEKIGDSCGVEAFEAIAGGETAGIPFAAWVSDQLGLPMCYVRKKPKGFGRNARIEGNIQPGQRVLLVEDMATDGGSKISFVDGLRDAEAICAHCAVIFHYGIFPEGIARLNAHGVSLTALATWHDILAVARKNQEFDKESLDIVQSFLDDPEGWKP